VTDARQALGQAGEAAARRALEARGYRILAARYRTRFGEIDLVARVDDVIVFVEVKARRSRRFGDPAMAVTAQKQQRLVAIASDYLARHRLHRAPARFDVVAITMHPAGRPFVEVFVDAFRPGW